MPGNHNTTAFSFDSALDRAGLGVLKREAPTWLQVNLGRKCNQACRHCHVDAGPTRTEMMSEERIDQVIQILHENPTLALVDITGGAPELHPSFRRLVMAARALGREVIDRCNLTILQEPGQEDLAAFLAEQGVHVVSSLPCYLEGNVDKQRGRGVFERSLAALRSLNTYGYGQGLGLVLDLVYNPVGAHLPPSQDGLEADYKVRLAEHGVVFDQLLTITNMPIARFARDLRRQGNLEEYENLLIRSFNPATVSGLMCRHLVSVSWDGHLYDCDFNQMLQLRTPTGTPQTLDQFGTTGDWTGRPIATARHCFGCTAGTGSSCGGALEA
ncbi:MAG TPA: radical SAM protein [Deltaproteobacteria bacterium]|nr:radical SAM protein [Deltaproteobacteria bacterium]